MAQKRPNILHIFADQLRFDAICANGNPVIRTPNLDRLSAMGVNYQRAYTPSPVCVAARCSMLTGCYPPATNCFSNDRMPEEIPSFMEILTRNGYRTHGIGKCHFTPDGNALRGFQNRERQEEMHPGSLEKEPYYQMLVENGFGYAYEAHGVRGPMYYIPQPSRLPARFHPTQWIGDRTMAFLRENTEEPWYLFSSFIHPHPPFTPPVPWHKLYDPVQMPLPKYTCDDESMQMFVNKIQNRYKYRDIGSDLNLIRCMKAYYYACVSFVDYQVGRILDTLEETGQMDNTLIVFTADHGELLGDYHCYGKRSMHDGPARIPMLVYQKGVFEGGVKIDTPVSLVDLAPTFLETAGVETDNYPMDGVSLTKREDGYVYSVFSCYQEVKSGSAREIPGLFREDLSLLKAVCGNYMITDGKWKYIYSAPDHREFLFDLVTDDETRNRAGTASCRPHQQRLKKQLMAFLKDGGLQCLIEKEDWKWYHVFTLPENPDSGLIVQDITCSWFDEKLPGYRES
ncbi:MAG: sulfatase-like hydrolase/transferase [Clostridia bacterium]|nr:sulfatase-like hydrolase/transferase [Clostridia bacterium]